MSTHSKFTMYLPFDQCAYLSILAFRHSVQSTIKEAETNHAQGKKIDSLFCTYVCPLYSLFFYQRTMLPTIDKFDQCVKVSVFQAGSVMDHQGARN